MSEAQALHAMIQKYGIDSYDATCACSYARSFGAYRIKGTQRTLQFMTGYGFSIH